MSIAMPKIAKRPSIGVVLQGIEWAKYVELRDMPENYNIRMTYISGDLDILSPSYQNEHIADLIGLFINVWAMEYHIRKLSFGKMTLRRKNLKLGFESDNCYYLKSRPKRADNDEFDFKKGPPPDLAIEVEKSRTSKAKMRVYAAFGVPELWRVVRQEIQIFEFDDRSKYQPRSTSVCLPGFPVQHVNELLKIDEDDETALLCAFRDWIRVNCSPNA